MNFRGFSLSLLKCQNVDAIMAANYFQINTCVISELTGFEDFGAPAEGRC